ncbi:MAG TPA: TolC family protein [Gemmatimonadaceae bacterium]|jgi:outer membrane protein
MFSIIRQRGALLGIVLGVAAVPTLGAQQPVGSAPAPATVVTFDQALKLALVQNTGVKQAQNTAALNSAGVTQSKLAFLPNLSVSANTGQDYGRNFSQADGQLTNTTTNSMNAGISSSVTLFDGMKNVSNLRSAQANENAGEQDLSRAKQTAVFTVASNFLSLVTQQQQLDVQQQNLAAQEALENQISQFVKAGSRPISDLYQQQATVASARASVVTAQNAVELAKVDLIQTLQLDPRGSYQFQAPALPDTAAVGAKFNLDSLLDRAFAQRPDLGADASRVEAAQQDVKAANASKWPTISLTGGYNSGVSSAADASFLDQLNQRRGGSIGIGISIPIFDRGATQAASERAQIAEDNAQLSLATQRQQVALEVRRAYLDYEAAEQQLAAADAQQKAATLAVTTTQQRYQVGAATLVEVTQARATQVQAQSAYINAKNNMVFQQSLMSYYTGELDPSAVLSGR